MDATDWNILAIPKDHQPQWLVAMRADKRTVPTHQTGEEDALQRGLLVLREFDAHQNTSNKASKSLGELLASPTKKRIWPRLFERPLLSRYFQAMLLHAESF
jgi:hypothetical protein